MDQQLRGQLRLQIARQRRRIDARLRATQQEGQRLLSWRTYVQRYPGWTAVAGLGLGLAAAAGVRRRKLSRRLGIRLLRLAFGRLTRRIWQEIKDLARGPQSAPAQGGEHGQT